MTADWFTQDERDRATGLRCSALKYLAEIDEKVAEIDPIKRWGSKGDLFRAYREAEHAAKFTWFLEGNADESLRLFRKSAEFGIAAIETNYPRPAPVIYFCGKFHYLDKKMDDTWYYKSKLINDLIKQGILDDLYEGEIFDLDTPKPVAFMNYPAREVGLAAPVMETSVISGDMELARKAAEISCTHGDFEIEKQFAWYGRVLKYTILSDEKNARICLERLFATPKRAPHHELGGAYAALLDGDKAEAEKNLAGYIKWFRKKRKPQTIKRYVPLKDEEKSLQLIEKDHYIFLQLIEPYFLFSTSGLAFCSLAASRGMRLEVDEPFLPGQLVAYLEDGWVPTA